MRVLVTRAEPAATRTADLLRSQGYNSVCMRMFRVVDTGASLAPGAYDSFVFTSTNTVRILSSRNWAAPGVSSTAYCVGRRTAEAAGSLGFSTVISVDGTAEDLAQRLKSDFGTIGVRMLYVAGEQRSYDLEGAVAGTGIMLSTSEIYRIVAIKPPFEAVNEVFSEPEAVVVLLYSHKTAKHVCETIFTESYNAAIGPLSAVAISAKTADAVLKYPFQQVYVADEPDEQSMMSKLSEISLA